MNIYDILLENPIQGIEEEIKIGSRNGQHLICKIKPISNERLAEIRKMCVKIVKNKPVIDMDKMQNAICAECTIMPNFNDAGFIQKLKVTTGDNSLATGVDALNKALLPGERDELYKQINRLCGYDTNIDEAIEDAKKQ